MKIKTNDGDVFEEKTWEEIIDKMRLSMRLGVDPDIKTFMEGLKRRCKVWNGSNIRTSDYETFIKDLVAGGFIEILEVE